MWKYKFKDASIGKKIAWLSVLMVVVSLGIGAIGNFGISNLGRSIEDLTHNSLVAVRNITLADMMHDGLRAVVYRAAIVSEASDEAVKKEVASELDDFGKQFVESLNTIDALSISEETKASIRDIRPTIDRYISASQNMTNLFLSGQRAEALSHMAEFQTVFEELEGKMATLGDLVEKNAGTSKQTAEKNIKYFQIAGLLSMAAGALTMGLVAWWIFLSILGPLKATVSTLSQSSSQFMNVSQQMGTAAEETSSQANTVAAAAEEISKGIQTVAAGMEEMEASIREIAKSSADAARVAGSAVKVAETTNANISKLGDSSAEIGKVIKVITSIAEQTNLLALNATIEAARAGEAGKGFAVVANEVKELAKETAKATEEISRKIGAIQTDSAGAVEAIGQIGSIIAQINNIQGTIASAVEEQTATTNEIGRNITEAARGSSEIAQSISKVAGLAQNASAGAGETQRLAGTLPQMSENLRSLVEGTVH